jgi:hypothetical protein
LSKQVFFVIGVDLDDKEVFISDDTYSARFSEDEQVWDTDANEWIEDDDRKYYLDALDLLNTKRLAKD